jgi:hypothetical protein
MQVSPAGESLFLASPEKVTKKNATLAGSVTTPAGRKLVSLRLLEVSESSTFGNSTAAIGGKSRAKEKDKKK